jgi:transcriptional regulator with XRE-family HTH domain
MQGSLARKLRVLRAERGLTLRQAAEQAGVRPGTLSELERGLHRPHDITLSRVAKGYGVPVEDLLEEPVPLDEASETGQPSATAQPRSRSAAEPHQTYYGELGDLKESQALEILEGVLEGRITMVEAARRVEELHRRIAGK